MDVENKQIVWCITHSLVIIRVSKIKKIPYKKWVDYLDTLIVTHEWLIIDINSNINDENYINNEYYIISFK